MQDKDFYLYVDDVRVKVSEERYLDWRKQTKAETVSCSYPVVIS